MQLTVEDFQIAMLQTLGLPIPTELIATRDAKRAKFEAEHRTEEVEVKLP